MLDLLTDPFVFSDLLWGESPVAGFVKPKNRKLARANAVIVSIVLSKNDHLGVSACLNVTKSGYFSAAGPTSRKR